MKQKWFLISLIGVLVLALALPALAEARGDFRSQGDNLQRRYGTSVAAPSKSKAADFAEFNLTDEQKSQIWQLQKENYQLNQELKTQLQLIKFDLRELNLQPVSEETAEQIREKLQEMTQIRQQMRENQNNQINQLLSILTPEQLSQLAGNLGNRGLGFKYGDCPRVW